MHDSILHELLRLTEREPRLTSSMYSKTIARNNEKLGAEIQLFHGESVTGSHNISYLLQALIGLLFVAMKWFPAIFASP